MVYEARKKKNRWLTWKRITNGGWSIWARQELWVRLVPRQREIQQNATICSMQCTVALFLAWHDVSYLHKLLQCNWPKMQMQRSQGVGKWYWPGCERKKKSEIWNKCVSKQEKRRQRLTHFFFPFSASCVCTKALWNFGVCVLRASERWEPWLTGIFKKVRRTRWHFRFQKWRGKCLWSHISATEEDYVICLLGYLVYFKDMYLGIKEEKNPNQNNVGTDPHELHEVLWKRMPRGTMSSR